MSLFSSRKKFEVIKFKFWAPVSLLNCLSYDALWTSNISITNITSAALFTLRLHLFKRKSSNWFFWNLTFFLPHLINFKLDYNTNHIIPYFNFLFEVSLAKISIRKSFMQYKSYTLNVPTKRAFLKLNSNSLSQKIYLIMLITYIFRIFYFCFTF